MATGDNALAAGMDLVAGTTPLNTVDTEINKTRDYIAERTNAVTPISKGGTGATTAAGARSALGVTTAAEVDKRALKNTMNWPYAVAQVETNPPHQMGMWFSGGTGRPVVRVDSTDMNLALKDDSDAAASAASNALSEANARVAKGGDTMTGDLKLPNASAATSSFTVAYINGDGRVSKGTSSIRYKDLLEDPDVNTLGNIFPTLRQYKFKNGDGKPTLGYIAEEVAESPDLQRFAVYQTTVDDDGNWAATNVVDSIDFIQLLIAQTAQLHARVSELEDRLAAQGEPATGE
ncbi:hypothetical protein RWH45_10660 [Microbacterium sp. KSW4-17]|uniref:Peptidase S74 domain-containing protein n=1 Tax=Microbacterium galbum TaxID=3075994 RepID=A0ABU3T8M9_9MICO|nr:hypothetical protein [Microbacterium sp. KSW4-17]MDU0367679.1 hypothetical protein [Microbacterium sp. KSW4-17]